MHRNMTTAMDCYIVSRFGARASGRKHPHQAESRIRAIVEPAGDIVALRQEGSIGLSRFAARPGIAPP